MSAPVDIDKLDALYARSNDSCNDALRWHSSLEDAWPALRDRLRELEQDARRYQYLREGRKGCYNTIMIHAGARLDSEIDSALDKSNG